MADPTFFSSDHVLGRTLRLPFEISDGRLRIATRGTVTGGAFKLRDTVTGEVTADIAYNASAADVVAALSALTGIRAADLTGSGGALGSAAVVIECVGRLRGFKAWERFELYGGSSSLTGSSSPAVDLTPQPQDLTDFTLSAMAKVARTDADSAAVFSLTESDGISVTSASDGQGEIEITPTHQSGVTWEESGTWVLALKGVDTGNSNRTYDLAEGYIKWVGPVDR